MTRMVASFECPCTTAEASNAPRASRNVALLIHPLSYAYVKYVADYISGRLSLSTTGRYDFIVTSDVARYEAPEQTLVYVIGDPFAPFSPRPDCYYVFVNFSLLYNLRAFGDSLTARAWIRAKRKAFMRRSALYDAALDFCRPQCDRLRRERRGSGLAIDYFPTHVSIPERAERSPHAGGDAWWDVCFVGSATPRRRAIRERLMSKGVSVSPFEVPDLHEAMVRSRIVLNVHYHRCNTLEAPRVIHALAAGSCLVTEHSIGLEDIVREECYLSTSYSDLVPTVQSLLRTPGEIERLSRSAERYMNTAYLRDCNSQWAELTRVMDEMADAKLGRIAPSPP